MIKYAVEAFILGVSMGGYCAISCAPFMVPYVMGSPKEKFAGRFIVFLQFLSGRLVAYLLFAAITSVVAISSGALLSPKVNSVLLIIASLLMIIFSFSQTNHKFCSFAKLGSGIRGFPIVTGFILGLNLCPPFLVALVNILKMKSVFYSCMYFLFLFLGTTIYLLPAAIVSAGLKSDFFRRIGTYLGLLAGFWFLLQGIVYLIAGR